MNQKALFEGYMKIAQSALDRWSERTRYQWKITLAFWALLAAGIEKRQDLHLRDLSPWVLLAAAGVLLLGFVIGWSRGIWVGNERDKRVAHGFRDAADQVLRNPTYVPPQTARQLQELNSCTLALGFLGSWVTWVEVPVTIVLLCLLCYSTLCGRPESVGPSHYFH